ncbi:MAG: transcription antitermination factor NusB, partial [Bradyrhizobium sp.]
MPHQKFAAPSEVPGLAARRIAADILDGVLHKHRTLDEQLEGAAAHPGLKTLSDRDRALMRHLVATILRRLGTLGHVLSRLLDRGIPTDAPRAQSALLIGAAQILWMEVPDHAAVDLSVRLVQSDRRAAKYAGLVNAVLRRCAREGQPLIDEVKSKTLDIPEWLMTRWIAHYGASIARDIAAAMSH